MLRRSCLFLLLCSALVADQVTLTNGDIITGTVVKKDGDKLTMRSPLLGEISMPWSAVKSLKSDDELVVVPASGETVRGKVATQGDTIQVAAPGASVSVPLVGVTAVRSAGEQRSWERLQNPGRFDLWTGHIDMGLALARGNARTDTLTTAFAASRVTRRDKIAVKFDQIYGTARVDGVTSTIASAVRGGWSYNRDISTRLFVSTMNDYERDTFQDLNLRFVVGGGLGRNAIKNERTSLGLLAGFDYNRENFTGDVSRDSVEFNVGDDFLHKFSAATSVTQSSRFFTNLSTGGEYRMNFDISGVTTLKKWLAWHVTASDRFLSNPEFGRQRNDLLLSTGFRLNFAR